jgi:peptide/nickel transport system permease protein
MLHLGFVFSGSVVIEAVFSYPGLGKVLYDAVLARDYPLMQFSFLLIAFTVIFANIIADLLYPILDPRIRKS